MVPFPDAEHQPLGLGMAGVTLGTMGLLLAFLPILGIPISAFGLLFGLIGFGATLVKGGVRLRWSVWGTGLSAAALAINIAIVYAPAGYLPRRDVPQMWQQVPDRPYVPPPER
jgi:hypothetical protein